MFTQEEKDFIKRTLATVQYRGTLEEIEAMTSMAKSILAKLDREEQPDAPKE